MSTLRLALVADIHGNALALQAALADIGRQHPDRVVILGDLVLNGPRPAEVVDAVIAAPLVAIASDGVMSHPRGVGTHARVLARYVRDQKTITLNDAIRKMSLMPAQRLEKATPDAKRVGRLQQGAADKIVKPGRQQAADDGKVFGDAGPTGGHGEDRQHH